MLIFQKFDTFIELPMSSNGESKHIPNTLGTTAILQPDTPDLAGNPTL